MAQIECSEAIAGYLATLNHEFQVVGSGEECVMATPFVRPDGEGIEVELTIQTDGSVAMSDMGSTISYLYVNGLTLSRTLMNQSREIARSHGVQIRRNALAVHVSPESIGQSIHGLIQAALEVSSLIHKRRPTARVQFYDEVESFIIHSGATYDVGYEVDGRREGHTFKFHVNSGRNLLIQPLSASAEAAARSWAERLAYRFADIRDMDQGWRPVAVLDDRSSRAEVWTTYTSTPITEYAIMWSEQDKLKSLLATPSYSYGPTVA